MKIDSVSLVETCNDSPISSSESISQPAFLRFWNIAIEVFSSAEVVILIDAFIKTTTAEQYILDGRSAHQLRHDGSAYLLNAILNSESGSSSPKHARQDILEALRDLSIGGNAESYVGLAKNFCRNRAFFVTADRKTIGIGPVNLVEGDVIAVLFGGGVPYILRPQNRQYEFIGESYVLGLADGQALEEWHAGRLVASNFELI